MADAGKVGLSPAKAGSVEFLPGIPHVPLCFKWGYYCVAPSAPGSNLSRSIREENLRGIGF